MATHGVEFVVLDCIWVLMVAVNFGRISRVWVVGFAVWRLAIWWFDLFDVGALDVALVIVFWVFGAFAGLCAVAMV